MTQPAHDATYDALIAKLQEPRLGIHEDGTEELKTWEQLFEQCQDAARALAALPSAIETPTERQVQAGAVILATTPLIDAPKQLTHNEWMGLSRSILEAANAAR